MIPGVQNPHWLAPPASVKASAQRAADPGIEAVEGRHLTTRHTAGGGDTRHTGGAVDPYRAAAALSLGTAPVFGGPFPQPVA